MYIFLYYYNQDRFRWMAHVIFPVMYKKEQEKKKLITTRCTEKSTDGHLSLI